MRPAVTHRPQGTGQPPVLPPAAAKEPEWHSPSLERFPDTGQMRALNPDGSVTR